MGRASTMTRAAVALVALALAPGCLPSDSRPDPGKLEVSVAADEAAVQGFVTDDGWQVSFDRWVTAVGDISLHLDDCVDYSRTRYNRLYDFTVAGEERVGVIHGLGRCGVQFRMRAPSADAVLMSGVSEADKELMRIEDSDAFEEEERTALIIIGEATRDGVVKRFDWRFRRSHSVRECFAPDGEESVTTLDIDGGDELTYAVEVRPEELFRSAPIRSSPTAFGPFAAADADDDGVVTFDELSAVDVNLTDVLEGVRDGLPADVTEGLTEMVEEAGGSEATLATLLYEILVPRTIATRGAGECVVEERRRFRF